MTINYKELYAKLLEGYREQWFLAFNLGFEAGVCYEKGVEWDMTEQVLK